MDNRVNRNLRRRNATIYDSSHPPPWGTDASLGGVLCGIGHGSGDGYPILDPGCWVSVGEWVGPYQDGGSLGVGLSQDGSNLEDFRAF
ncbi:MAG: hypothetical protein OHK0012_04220 [Synechococcales cyanobacterium]